MKDVAATVDQEPGGKPCPVHFEMHQTPAKPPCKCQGLRTPRQLHAGVGFFLIGFLLVHLSICFTGINPQRYQSTVDRLEAALAQVPGSLLLVVFLPLAVQLSSGLYLLAKHGIKYNVKKCNRGGKLRFYLQRVSALLLLAFLLIHVGTLHRWGLHQLYTLTHISALQRYADNGLFHAKGDAFASTVTGLGQAWSAGSFHLP